MPGCGKEEVLVVAKNLGFSIVRMGDVVREEAQRRGLPITDATVGGMAHAERESHGFGIWAERTLPRILGERVVVDGLRGRAELEVFRKAFGEALVVVAVHASPRMRHERMLRRKRLDDALTIEAVRARDLRELSWGLGDVIATADVMLVNEASLDEDGVLHFRLDKQAAYREHLELAKDSDPIDVRLKLIAYPAKPAEARRVAHSILAEAP